VADRRVSAEWAVVGKAPATVAYGILATSGGDTDFGSYVGRYATGSPDRAMSADAPGAPPWVTFGPMVKPSGETLICVSVQEPAQDLDRSGRPISPQRLFLIRYADLAEAGASYQGLWQGLRDAALPTADRGPLTVSLGHQATDGLVATIERYGPERMIALAAMILESRIILADSTGLPRSERLAVLDAAVALLPYGFRAALSTSSAVNNTVSHEIDLVFAEFVNDRNEQTVVPLSSAAPTPVPRTKLGRSYQDLLRAKIHTPGLRAVVEHLWAWTTPCSLQHQGAALEILAQLDFDGSLRRALRDGTASREQLLAFFGRDPALIAASWRSPAMTEPMRQRAVRLMLDGPDGAVPDALLSHWPIVEDDLCAVAGSGLDAGEITLSGRCLDAAGRYSAEAEDRFLAKLVASEHAAPNLRPTRSAALTQLLEAHGAPSRGSWPVTREQVTRDKDETWSFRIFREMLTRQASPGGHLEQAAAWVSWLCLPAPTTPAGLPPWAGTVGLACGANSSPAARAALDPEDLIWAAVVLRLAAFSGRLPETLPCILDDLVGMACATAGLSGQPGRSAARGPNVQFLLDALDVDLWRARVRPDIVAVVDVTRVLLGSHKLRNFPAGVSNEQILDGYIDGLGHVLGVALPQGSRSELARQILSYVLAGQPDDALSTGAVWLLNSWSADPKLSADVAGYIAGMDEAARPVDVRLASSYWDCVARVPALAGYVTAPRLAAAVRVVLAEPGTALARRTGPGGVNSTQIALTCYGARRAGLPVSEILRILGQLGLDRVSPRGVDDLMREFQGLLYHDPELAPDAQDDMFACYESIAQGAFGSQYAKLFAEELITRCRNEIVLREEIIRRAGGLGGNGWHGRSGLSWRMLAKPRWLRIPGRGPEE
jgi:hypothetical protein